MQELKYCNLCPKRANCVYFKKNSFCEKEKQLEEEIYGYDKSLRRMLMQLFIINDNNTNQNSKYSKMIRKEIKEILEFFEEQKKEKEDEKSARFQESAVVAVE